MPIQRTAVIDFDNTLAGYDHWRGPEILGPPIPYALDAVRELDSWSWHLVVFTTRGDTDRIRGWLAAHCFPRQMHAVNSTAHNPPDCSAKPIAEVYFDDRDAHCVQTSPYNWHRAMSRVRRLYQPRGHDSTPQIRLASVWSNWTTRLLIAPRVRRKFRQTLSLRLDTEQALLTPTTQPPNHPITYSPYPSEPSEP